MAMGGALAGRIFDSRSMTTQLLTDASGDESEARHRLTRWFLGVAVLVVAAVAWTLYMARPAVIGLPQNLFSVPAPTPAQVNPAPGVANHPAVPFPTGPAEIVKLVEAGVQPEVVKAYVGNSPVAYQLNADEIIALYRRGVAPAIIVAMIERGAALRAQTAAGRPGPTLAKPARH